MSILSAMLLLMLVLDPIGNIPLFLAALKNVDHSRHRLIIIRESCIGLLFLLLFLFFGRYLLVLLHISQSSLLILIFSNWLRRVLRVRGIMAMERLMGMLLTTVAVEMLLTGIK